MLHANYISIKKERWLKYLSIKRKGKVIEKTKAAPWDKKSNRMRRNRKVNTIGWKRKMLSVMDWMFVASPKSYVEALTPI